MLVIKQNFTFVMQLALIILYSPIIINLAIILNITSEASLTPCRHAPFTRRAPAASTPTRRPRGRGDPPPPAFFTSGPQRMGLTRVIDVNIFHGHWHHNTPGTAPCLAIPGKSITMYSRPSRPRDSRERGNVKGTNSRSSNARPIITQTA